MLKAVSVFLGLMMSLNVSLGAAAKMSPATLVKDFELVEISADTSELDKNQLKVLKLLIEASDTLHKVYLRQVWSGNEALREKLAKDKTKAGESMLRAFDQNAGPWAVLHEEAPFVSGVPPRPKGAGFYPEHTTQKEFESWYETLSAEDKEKARSNFTVILRAEGDKFKSVPYHEAYAAEVKSMAKALEDAAGLEKNSSLKKILKLRSRDLLTDKYFDSDVAWLGLESRIDVTFGPYETYDDKLFGYKASYESFIGLVDIEHSRKLSAIASELQGLENDLPMEDKYKNKKLGAASPIRIVNLIYTGGDARGGVMTAAFNLPNDEQVLTLHGSKKIMLKNVQQAKFNKVLKPLAQLAVSKDALAKLDFDAFFTHILAHELAHGIGPHEISVNKPNQKEEKTTVRKELKDHYAAIEEAKADILGLWIVDKLVQKGVLAKSLMDNLYETFLASAFRSVRFGIDEAHGKGIALQFNYLWDRGAFFFDKKTKTFAVHKTEMAAGVAALAKEILALQAEGSYTKAKDLLAHYAKIRPQMKAILDKAKHLPVDVEPKFVTAAKIMEEASK